MKDTILLYSKKIVFIFLFSTFIIIFDRLRIYPNINISIYKVFQIPILFIIIIFLIGRKKIKFNLYNPMIVLLFGFLLSVLVSTLFSIYQRFALIEARRIFELIISAFLVFLFIKDIWNESNWLIFAKMLMVTGAISGLSIITDFFGWTRFYNLYYETESLIRSIGILAEPNYAAGKLGVFLPFAIFCVVYYKQHKKILWSFLSIISTFLIIIAIIFTGSRMGGVIAFFSLFIVYIKGINIRLFLLKRSVLLIIFILLLIFFINQILPNMHNFMAGIFDYTIDSYTAFFKFLKTGEETLGRSSITKRIKLFGGGIKIFSEYPLFGIGPGNFKNISKEYIYYHRHLYSHNTFITVLTECGIIGFVFFIGICLRTINNIYYYYKNSVFNCFYFYLGLSFINLLIMFFFLHSLCDKYFWGMFVVISLLLDNKKFLINRSKNN